MKDLLVPRHRAYLRNVVHHKKDLKRTTKYIGSATVVLFLLLALGSYAQLNIEWESNFGGSSLDYSFSGIQTSDGGYIATGLTQSLDGDVTGHNGFMDAWVVKLDNEGTLEWEKCLGGSDYDEGNSIIQASDGNFIVAGTTLSNDGDVTGNYGNSDCWIVKIDQNGSIIWQSTIGGTFGEEAHSIQQTSDGGYIVFGTSRSEDGDVSDNQGLQDYWVVKLSESGSIEWEQTYGGSGFDYAECVRQTSDGGYILAGSSESTDGDISQNIGSHDFWIVKLDDQGLIEWEKNYGGTYADYANTIELTNDSGYVVAGSSWSSDGDLNENNGDLDFWVIKLTESGLLQWQISLGGSQEDWARSIVQIEDGGFIVAGMAISDDGDISNPNGDHDSWLVKLSENGELEWEESIGGSGQESFFSIETTSDGGLVAFGQSTSTDGDVSANNGFRDFWIAKFEPNSTSLTEQSDLLNVLLSPNPATEELIIELPKESIGVNFSIYNQAGFETQSGRISGIRTPINIQSLYSGLYLLKIWDDRSLSHTRFIKN